MLRQLLDLAPQQHWFCGATDSSDDAVQPEPVPREQLAQLVQPCFQLFAYDTAEAEQHKGRLIEGIDRQLGKCAECILNYYQLRENCMDLLRE